MHVLAEYLPERVVKKVCRGVIALGIATAVARDACSRLTQLNSAGDFAERSDASIDFAHFVDVNTPAIALDLAAVGHLSAGLDIKRRFTKDHGRAPVGQIAPCDYLGGDVQGVVAGKCCRAV